MGVGREEERHIAHFVSEVYFSGSLVSMVNWVKVRRLGLSHV